MIEYIKTIIKENNKDLIKICQHSIMVWYYRFYIRNFYKPLMLFQHRMNYQPRDGRVQKLEYEILIIKDLLTFLRTNCILDDPCSVTKEKFFRISALNII
jgi:hypothetical protein